MGRYGTDDTNAFEYVSCLGDIRLAFFKKSLFSHPDAIKVRFESYVFIYVEKKHYFPTEKPQSGSLKYLNFKPLKPGC